MAFISLESVFAELKKLQEDSYFQQAVQKIKPGKFKRDLKDEAYNNRMIYTNALRNFVYNQGVMNAILTDKNLKELFFRTFGYTGTLNFNLYPNCWLRDLPLLDLGDNCYLGDGILLGTNQVSPDQKWVSVGKISIGNNGIFDQGCAIGYNTTIGENATVGFRTSIGLKNHLGNQVSLREHVKIGHGCKIGNRVKLGSGCKIGHFCTLSDGIKLDEFTTIPSFSKVTKEGVFNRKKGQVA